MPTPTLEDIILCNDRRGMSLLRPYLPARYCQRAGQLLWENQRCVLIVTGFYVDRISAPETDGPPGALAVGRAVSMLGGRVVYVSDRYTAPLLEAFCHDGAQVITFPICDDDASRETASQLLTRVQPSLLLSVERCGVNASGRYLNCRGQDVSAFTARLDALFHTALPSIGIGDGGNEIGMGKLAGVIPTIPGLPVEPAVTATTDLIATSVSNWGAYGLVAALSALAGHDLLPEAAAEEDLLRRLYDAGCYDGTCGEPVCGVDGFTLAENSQVITRLSNWLHEVR